MRDVVAGKVKEAEVEVKTDLLHRPWGFAGEGLGLVVAKAPPTTAAQLNLPRGAGLIVHRVAPHSPAAAADILHDDVLHRLDGQLLVNNEQFEVVVGALPPGREVQVELFRDGAPLKRTIKTGAGPR